MLAVFSLFDSFPFPEGYDLRICYKDGGNARMKASNLPRKSESMFQKLKSWLKASTWRFYSFVAGTTFLVWFCPWVLLLHTGTLLYYPYNEDGKSRFPRLTGPVTGLLSDDWVGGDDIPAFCFDALVAAEDTRFFDHWGLEWGLMADNLQRRIQGRPVRFGGSTLTQQLVKNAFLSRDRSLLRKSREALGALILDVSMGKRQQLTWYLNAVEFGPNLYGVRQGAAAYFKKEPEDLSPSECASLVAILPNPKLWGSSLRRKRLSQFMRKRYGTVVYRAKILEQASKKDVRLAMKADPFGRSVLLPAYALKKKRRRS